MENYPFLRLDAEILSCGSRPMDYQGIGSSRCDSHAELTAGAFVTNGQDAVKARKKYFGVFGD
jgi:hypothetical protein